MIVRRVADVFKVDILHDVDAVVVRGVVIRVVKDVVVCGCTADGNLAVNAGDVNAVNAWHPNKWRRTQSDVVAAYA